MSMPPRPLDTQLANIIDKLAEFVARNGPEFEALTKIKQQNNIKFSFLQNNDPNNGYYQSRVMEERKKAMGLTPNSQNNFQPNIWSNNGNQQQTQPAVNLTPQIEAINVKQMSLREQIMQSENNLQAQHQVLLQQQKTQIEEAIANAQTEHIQRCAQEHQIQLQELEDKLQPLIESCTKEAIQNAANEEQNEKLNKLLTLWSSKANFFDSCAITKLQSPSSSLQEYRNTLLSQHAAVITPLSQATKAKFDSYQQQHQTYAKHATNQIAILEAEKQTLELQQQQQTMKQQQQPLELTQNSQMIPSLLSNVINRNDMNMIQTMFSGQNFPNQHQNFPIQSQPPQDINNQFQNFNLPPPNFPVVPDLSRPPPGFNSSAENTPPPSEPIEEPDPQPYFTLPAGVMAPLIGLECCSYQPLDSTLVKPPPATKPSEKLLNAVEAFYSAPSHERPRDTEGWEKLGLYEYFKVKNAIRKQKEESIAKGERQKSKSPSPIPDYLMKPSKKQKKRVYRSKSPEGRTSPVKSRSPTPELRPLVTPTANNRNRSRKRSRSPSPAFRSFNREQRRMERKRSVTPPSFMGANTKAVSEFIDEGNKGHQMLKKLGWTSGGLGGKNQGIAEPISGGELRDRSEMYKGVGMASLGAAPANDPYENFRKNRSNNFIVRMKTRGEEKH